jgi:hypothetical protein
MSARKNHASRLRPEAEGRFAFALSASSTRARVFFFKGVTESVSPYEGESRLGWVSRR